MPEEVDSGRLYLEVAADATGLRRDLKTKLDAATTDLRAKIQVELDAKRLAIQARAAAREASKAATVKAQITFDAKQARTALNKALREAKANARVRIDIQFDAAKTRRDLNATVKAAADSVRPPKIDVNVAADTGRARADIDTMRREQEARPIKLRTEADSSSLAKVAGDISSVGGALMSLSTAPGIASGVAVLAGAAVNAAGALFSMGAAASQAGGLLAALPGLAAAGAQGLAAAVIGFSGVTKAVQALQKQQTSAAGTATSTAATQAAAAEQIRAARERVAVAQESAAQQVASAERNLKNAHDAERQAQEALTKARKDAAEALVQLAFDVRQANLSEAQAEIDLQHAQAKYTQTMQSVTATATDKRQADLDLKQAQLNLDEAKKKQADLTKEQQKSAKAGVEGSDQVKAAKKSLLQTQQQEVDAEKALSKAHRDSARQVADAQRALAQAMKQTGAAAGGAAGGVNALNAAMNGLSPAAQNFARFVSGTLIPRFNRLRNAVATALLPPLQRGITAALPLLDTVQKQLVRTGGIIGDVGEKFGKWAGSPAFRKDTATIMGANNVALTHFGQAGLYLADALRNIMVVASPLVVRISQLTERWAKSADAATKTGRETGRMADFFDRAWATAAKLWHITRDLAVAIYNLGRAARPSGDTLLDSLARATEKLRQWTADPANQTRIQSFFENTVPLARNLGNLLNRVVELLVRLGQATGGHTLDGLFKVLNVFADVLDKIAGMPGGGTILSTILLLSGAGLGLGLVAKFVGGIVGNLGKLSKYTGASKLLSLLTGRGKGGKGKTALGDLADDAARMGGAIDDELPKDKKKSTALDLVGNSAGGAKKPMKELESGVKTLGGEAEKGAVKSTLFSRILTKLGGVAKGLLGPLGKVGGLLLSLPGVGKLTSLLGSIKLPKLSIGGAGGEGGALAGLKGFFGSVGKFLGDEAVILAAKAGSVWRGVGGALTNFKLPALSGVLSRFGTWFKGLGGGIGKLAGSAFKGGGKGLLGRVGVGAAEGGAKGVEGGPLGIIGGVLAGVVGQLIGGGKGGARGAVGGAISGGATGAGVGGLIGSVVPGIGNVVGAVLGGVVGAVIGAITGGHWWGAVGTFFTKTFPTFLLDQVKKVPGLVLKGLEGLASLETALGGWLLKGMAKLPSLIGQGLGWALKTIPPMILDILFTGVEYALKGAFRLPNVFGFLLNMALKEGPKLYVWIEKLPFTLLRLFGQAVVHAPSAFGWLSKQAQEAVHKLPAILGGGWRALTNGANIGAARMRAVVRQHLGNIGKDFQQQSRKFVAYMAAAWIRTVNGVRTGLRGAVTWTTRHLSSIRSAFASAGRYVAGRISAAMSTIGRYIRSGLKSAQGYASRGLSSVRSAFSSAASKVGSTIRSLFTRTIPNLAHDGMNATWKRISGVLSTIRSGFSTAVNAVQKTWQGLENKLAGPVRWIGTNVYTKGIKKIWDLVASKVKMDPLPVYHGFASGGIYGALPGYTPGRDVMNIPAVGMSGGEAIMRPEWTRAVGPAFVDFFNRLARTGGVKAVQQAMQGLTSGGLSLGGFKSGGIVPERIAAFADGGIFGAISSGWSKFTNAAKGLFSGGLKKAADWVMNPILSAVGGAMAPTGNWGQMLGKLPPQMASKFIDYIVKTIEPKLGGDALGVVAQAKKFIGIGDDRGENNNQWTRAWGMPGAAWCAMFVSDMIHRAHAEKHYRGYSTALAAGYDRMQHVPTSQGRPGDLATYNNGGHINIIEKPGGSGYWTIGGNQNHLVQRGLRMPQVVLRPTGAYASGGVYRDKLVRGAKRMFFTEAPRNADKDELKTPLVKLIRSLSPNLAPAVLKALMDSHLAVTTNDQVLKRDTGGVVPPGRHMVDNSTGGNEWVLSPEAIRLLGGERAVATLNANATRVRRAAVAAGRTALAPTGTGGHGDPTVNVFPQPKQSEEEIGMIAARKLGAML